MLEFYSQSAEQAVLGAMLLDNKIADSTVLKLKANDFYETRHKKIFTAMEMLAIEKATIDMITVGDYLEKHEGMKSEGYAYLSELTSYCVSTANTDSYISTVKGYAIRRALMQKADEIKEIAGNMDKPVQEAYCDVLAAVESVKPQNDNAEDKSLKAIMLKAYIQMGEKANGKGGMGVETGIASFDAATGGLYPGELTIIGARPGVGKSALGMQMALGFAKKGKKVMFFSLEMSEEQYAVRVFSYGSGVSSQAMRTGKVKNDEWAMLHDTLRQYGKLPIKIETKLRTPLQMRNAILNEGDVALVVVDYLQLVRPNGKYGSREQEVASVSRAFKELTLELGIPAVVMSQLNRGEGNGEPNMRHLRESGAIEQDADVIILMHEPDKWKNAEDQQEMDDCMSRGHRLVKVMIEKQRQGSRCFFNLVFRPQHMDFISLMKKEMEV